MSNNNNNRRNNPFRTPVGSRSQPVANVRDQRILAEALYRVQEAARQRRAQGPRPRVARVLLDEPVPLLTPLILPQKRKVPNTLLKMRLRNAKRARTNNNKR